MGHAVILIFNAKIFLAAIQSRLQTIARRLLTLLLAVNAVLIDLVFAYALTQIFCYFRFEFLNAEIPKKYLITFLLFVGILYLFLLVRVLIYSSE